MTLSSSSRLWIITLLVLSAAAILLWMGRPLFCACGELRLWVGDVKSAHNSQHLADWYVPSHIIHGFLFYLLGWAVLRRRPVGDRLIFAVALEAAWELVENSRWVIDRYRETTLALGYQGDSVLNSVADLGWMMLGFALASRLPVRATIALALGFELLTLILIRDNLLLNILMLVAPIDAISVWQGGS